LNDKNERVYNYTTSFDNRGNALEQTSVTDYYEDGVVSSSEAQRISNGTYDFHDRNARSKILNYEGRVVGTSFLDAQDIHYYQYDRYNNAGRQTVETYSTDNMLESSIISHKETLNSFNQTGTMTFTQPDGSTITIAPGQIAVKLDTGWIEARDQVFAQKKGSVVSSTTTEWKSMAENIANQVSKTESTTSMFDARANALDQTTNNYAADEAGAFKLTTRTHTVSSGYNPKGDASEQHITTETTDETGAVSSLDTTEYRVLTNRKFDGRHNITNQMSYTYDNENMATLISAQETRSEDYSYSGVARHQTIVTYIDQNLTQISDVRDVRNSYIDSRGNVGSSVTSTYESAAIADDPKWEGIHDGAITLVTLQNEIGRAHV
jgi:hypothetical protein